MGRGPWTGRACLQSSTRRRARRITQPSTRHWRRFAPRGAQRGRSRRPISKRCDSSFKTPHPLSSVQHRCDNMYTGGGGLGPLLSCPTMVFAGVVPPSFASPLSRMRCTISVTWKRTQKTYTSQQVAWVALLLVLACGERVRLRIVRTSNEILRGIRGEWTGAVVLGCKLRTDSPRGPEVLSTL